MLTRENKPETKANPMSDTCNIDRNETGAQEPEVSAFGPGPGKHVLFFGDPMCSWCWGFEPELAQLAERAQNQVQFHVVMGGLRPGTKETWDEAMRGYIRHHWEDVEAKTGQPFDYARFNDADFVYDTEPGCRAVITAREIVPDRALAYYEALQRGFYAENKDITKTDTLADIAAQTGIDRDPFIALFSSQEMRGKVAFDFKRTQAFGVQGFPSVLCAEDGQYAFLALGYRPYRDMQGDFEAWLDS